MSFELCTYPLDIIIMFPRFVCVLDFEATCDNPVNLEKPEVIEFPSVLLELAGDQYTVKSEFQQYVRPEINPVLTDFCTELTGIRQAQVDKGARFDEALRLHHSWLASCIGTDPNDLDPTQFIVATCGDWDIRTMLPVQARNSDLAIPRYLQTFSNVKTIVARFKGSKKAPKSVNALLHFVGKTFVGQHHSGIDDCRNIAVVVVEMGKKGAALLPTGRLVANDLGEYTFTQCLDGDD